MLRRNWTFILVAACTLALGNRPASAQSPAGPDTIAHVHRVTDGNQLGLSITNYGFLGNDLVTRDPSMEYPLGSEMEHLIRAGPWIGAITVNGDTMLTHGAQDGYWRTGGRNVSEFTPRTRWIAETSSLISKNTYSQDAVSEQDFVSCFDDLTPKPSTVAGWEGHRPMGIQVTLRSYLWSAEFADDFVILSYDVKNVSGATLVNMYLGMYIQLVTGNKGAYERWPPSGWFYFNTIHYDEDIHMVLEHHANFGGGVVPYWSGVRYLGATPAPDTARVMFNVWNWTSGDNTMDEDREKYEIMGNGEVDNPYDIPVATRYSPILLLSVGPYSMLPPDSTIQMVWAFAGGTSHDHIRANSEWAQRAYDHDYILPTAPPSPRMIARPGKNKMDIWWDDSAESVVDPFDGREDFEGYRIYVTRKEGALAEEFTLVQELDRSDTPVGYNTGMNAVLAPEPLEAGGITYPYCWTLSNLKDGFKYWVSVTSFDQGSVAMPSLESGISQNKSMAIPGPRPGREKLNVTVFPNPYHGDAVWDGARERERVLWFANLPERATIRIFSLSGDLVDRIDFDGASYTGGNVMALQPGVGERQVLSGAMCAWDLISSSDQPVASGLYMFTVTDDATGENFVGKFMVIR
ncbi:MAG: hypothetical protein KAW17_03360 [Candidatus Eisenbacteria sp.]|nr:hypothetical protein [Candidatus Eisenbacteria bacterium]